MKTHFHDLPPGVIIRQWYMDHPVDTTRTKKSLCVGVREILTLVNTLSLQRTKSLTPNYCNHTKPLLEDKTHSSLIVHVQIVCVCLCVLSCTIPKVRVLKLKSSLCTLGTSIATSLMALGPISLRASTYPPHPLPHPHRRESSAAPYVELH